MVLVAAKRQTACKSDLRCALCGGGSAHRPSGGPHRANCITMAKAKAGKRKAEPEAAEQAAAPPAEPPREVRRRVAVEKEALGPIHHDSHGQVRRTHSAAPSPAPLARPALPAAPSALSDNPGR